MKAVRQSEMRWSQRLAHLRASGAFKAQRAERGYAVFLKLLRDAAMRKLLDAALERDDAATAR